MNAIITHLKTIALLVIVVLTMNSNAFVPEKCKPCAAAHAAKLSAQAAKIAAAKLSIQAAHAATLAAGKPVARETEFDFVDSENMSNSERCAACEAIKQSIADAHAASLIAAGKEVVELVAD
jgi:hypothetical protein